MDTCSLISVTCLLSARLFQVIRFVLLKIDYMLNLIYTSSRGQMICPLRATHRGFGSLLEVPTTEVGQLHSAPDRLQRHMPLKLVQSLRAKMQQCAQIQNDTAPHPSFLLRGSCVPATVTDCSSASRDCVYRLILHCLVFTKLNSL